LKLLKLIIALIILSTPARGDVKPLLTPFWKARTVEVRFKQLTKIPVAGDTVDLYEGILYLKKPMKLLWKYTRGSRIFIVSDGKFVETVFPSEKECRILPIEETTLLPLIKLLEGESLFNKSFKLKETERSGNLTVLSLEPRTKDSYFKEVKLFFKGKKLIAIKTTSEDGTESTYQIVSVQLNKKLPENLFRLVPCKGNRPEGRQGGHHGNRKEGDG